MNRFSMLLAAAGCAALVQSTNAQVLRMRDDVVRSLEPAEIPANIEFRNVAAGCCPAPDSFSVAVSAKHGQPVPGGGTLSPLAAFNPATVNNLGQIAFISNIDGTIRNQAVVVATGGVLKVIARGCGQGGGAGDVATCGDATPIGGTFAGLFGGTVFAPPINDSGDVLFFADVENGSSSRGLFLYTAATNTIRKVAVVGDASPLGGTLSEIGPGSMNNLRQIAFIAKQSTTGNVNIYRWDNGVITKHAAVNDPAPGGGNFQIIAGESFGFVDGTFIPIGAVPGINDLGQVSFFSTLTNGSRGLFVTTGGVHAKIVGAGDASPVGGTFFDFFTPLINNAGQIAFYSDISLGAGQFTGGWFVGTTGNFRKALAFYDALDNGQNIGLAVSRNPINALDDCGNLTAWGNIQHPDLSETEVLVWCDADGSQSIIAKKGQATPIGGTYNGFQSWPAMNNSRQGLLSAFTLGAPGGVFNAHFVFTASTTLAADLDHDGDVDLSDLGVVLSAFGLTNAGDFDGDGDTDLSDLGVVLSEFGLSCR